MSAAVASIASALAVVGIIDISEMNYVQTCSINEKRMIAGAGACASADMETEEDPCPVCFEALTKVNTVIVDGCGHEFCRDCMSTMRARCDTYDNEGLGIKVIKCPMCRGTEKVSSESLKVRVKQLLSDRNMITFEVQDLRTKCRAMEKALHKASKDLRNALPKPPRATAAAPAPRTTGFMATVMAGADMLMAAAPTAAAPTAAAPTARTTGFMAAPTAEPTTYAGAIAAIQTLAERRDMARFAVARDALAARRTAHRRQRNEELGHCCVAGCSARYRTRGKCSGNCGRFCCSRCKKCANCV